MTVPSAVTLVEVGPRDGLQNESVTLSTADKIDFINQLSDAGLAVIEATSFVSPKWIPQLADHTEVFRGIRKNPGTVYPVFVPNLHGMQNALAAGATSVAVFTTPSETFCTRNIHMTVAQSLEQIAMMTALARTKNVRVRAYVSCAIACPYEGVTAPQAVAGLAEKLLSLGCDEISLGDTIGVGTPKGVEALLQAVGIVVPVEKLAVHFHDTYGQALVNIYVALAAGIRTIDSAVAGLGGCPYARGATGNVATEEVVYMLNGLGVHTGVSLEKLVRTGQSVTRKLGRPVLSRVSMAMKVE